MGDDLCCHFLFSWVLLPAEDGAGEASIDKQRQLPGVDLARSRSFYSVHPVAFTKLVVLAMLEALQWISDRRRFLLSKDNLLPHPELMQ
jgi:hypothetical protein